MRVRCRPWMLAIVWSAMVAGPVQAQAPPWRVLFTASADHTTLDAYDLILTRSGDPPLAPLPLGKPESAAGADLDIAIDATVARLPPGTYTGVVRAWRGPAVTASDPSPAFTLLPQPSLLTVLVNTVFSVAFTHDGVATDGYRLYLDDVLMTTVPVSARSVGGEVVFVNLRVTTCAPHTVQASAFNAIGETRSVVLAFVGTGCPPAAPVGLRIVQGGGG